MAFCSHCGAQIADEAVICVNCGCSTGKQPVQTQSAANNSGLDTAIKVFMIIALVIAVIVGCCTIVGFVALAWIIPMTVVTFKRLNNGQPLGMGLKICTLLFVNLIAGILMLCRKDD